MLCRRCQWKERFSDIVSVDNRPRVLSPDEAREHLEEMARYADYWYDWHRQRQINTIEDLRRLYSGGAS